VFGFEISEKCATSAKIYIIDVDLPFKIYGLLMLMLL
jgi:hypothetical protein